VLFVNRAEFLFDGSAVGYFEDGAYPRVAGRYRYMPYRGPGHYEMVTRLESGSGVSCYYDHDKGRVLFTVMRLVAYGLLDLDDFVSHG
jgi:hypothetical protein